MMVLGTYRDNEVTGNHPLTQTLGSLAREEHFLRLQLGGLSRQEVGEFVESRAGTVVAAAAVDTLHERTEGNPLFVGEVVGSVSPEEMDRDPTCVDSIPGAVREAILRRLSRLSEPCNQLLRTASVIGRDFDLPLLRALSPEITEDEFRNSIDEALGIRIVELSPAGTGGYRFSHALIQQAVYEEIPPMRRAQAHAVAGETLEKLHQDSQNEYAGVLAHHFAEAEAVLGPDRLVQYSLVAGERALASHGVENAVIHFEKGLLARKIDLTETMAASDEEAADLLFGLARARAATFERHRLGEVFATLSRAFAYYAEAGNIAQAVAAAAFPIAPAGVLIPGVAPLMARALTLVPADSHESGRLLSRYGGILGAAEGDYEGAQEALMRAISIARREGDVPLEVQTLTNACDVSGRHLQWQESVENGERAIGLLTGDENPYFEVLSRLFTALGFIHMGDPDGARPHALALRDLMERGVAGILASLSSAPIIYLSCVEGDWKAGREYSDRSLKVAPMDPLLLVPRVLLEHETGESAQGEIYLERLLEAMRRSGPGQIRASGRVSLAITTIARITGVPDRLEIAREAAEWILSKKPVTPGDAIPAKVGLALLAVQEGDQAAAKEHHAYLLGKRGTMALSVASVDRLLGLLSQTMGNLEQSASHFEDSMAFWRQAGYKPELAWTCHDYTDMLMQRDAQGHPEKARSLLQQALAISTELGMRPLTDRVVTLQADAESPPEEAPAYPDGLTDREVEVLRLVAAGKSNRDIAQDLVISLRAAANHVANILNKTGLANRTEAAAYAIRQDLV